MSILRMSRSALVIILSLVILVLYLLYSYSIIIHKHSGTTMEIWKTVQNEYVPEEIWKRADQIKVGKQTLQVNVVDAKVETFARVASPLEDDPDPTKTPVLLLHGASFSSKTWLDLKTIQFIAALGHKVVAIDLPGYGESPPAPATMNKRTYLRAVIKKFDIARPIIVIPSMAGSYAIPYIMEETPAKAWQRATGMVAIAPVGTKQYAHAQYHRVRIPTLIIRGDKDKRLGLEASSSLQNTFNNVNLEFKDSGHACYMDDPKRWHNVLYNYLLGVEQGKTVTGDTL